MTRIINSRLYQGLIPITNYLILGVLATAGLSTVFLAFPLMSACITTAFRIYGKGNEIILKPLWQEVKRNFWKKTLIGFIVSVFSLAFHFLFLNFFHHVSILMRVSFVISLIFFIATVIYMIMEEYLMKNNFQFKRLLQNSILDVITELPYTILFSVISCVILVSANIFPLIIFISLTLFTFVLALLYNKKLKFQLSRF